MELAEGYVVGLQHVLRHLPWEDVEKVCRVLHRAYLDDKTVFLFGNRESAALASHMACDLGKGTFAPNHLPLPDVKRFKLEFVM